MAKKALLALAAAATIMAGGATLQPQAAHATFMSKDGGSTHGDLSSWWAQKMARKCAWKAQHGWNPSWCAKYMATQYVAPAPAPAPAYRPMK